MEEIERDAFMKSSISKRPNYKLSKRHHNYNFNPKIIFYILIIIIFLLLLVNVIILKINNNNLKQKLELHELNKRDLTLNINNKEENYKLSKRLFHFKDDDNFNTTKNKIHVSYSLDNQLIYPTLVSMTSGLENINNSTNILIYHLLLSHNFNTSKISIFESLKDNYEVKINYYIIPPIFNSSNKWTDGTDCVYYKIILPLMFPDIKRMIYLDGDTLIRKDILEMYEYPFNDCYILGFPFYMPYVMDRYRINATHYINGGCLLFNIEKIRKDKKDVDLLQFTIKRNYLLRFREQDSINYIFYPKIDFLPLKYGIFMIGTRGLFNSFAKLVRSPLNLTEGYEAIKDPAIVHFSCCWPKIWNNGTKNLFKYNKICLKYQKEFYYYANKTNYYWEIYKSLY